MGQNPSGGSKGVWINLPADARQYAPSGICPEACAPADQGTAEEHECKWKSVPSPRYRSKPIPLVVGVIGLLLFAPQARATPEAPVLLAQGAGDLLELGKDALGLGGTTPEGSERTGISGGVPFLVRFEGSVGGLEPGAPVRVQGMRMGAVRDVRVRFDAFARKLVIPVVIELDPQPFSEGEQGGDPAAKVQEAMRILVQDGLRAKIAAVNLIPGQLGVVLETDPDAALAELGQSEDGMAVIPSVDVSEQMVGPGLERLTARLAELPLEDVTRELQGLLAAARQRAADPALSQLLSNLAASSESWPSASEQVAPTLGAVRDLAARAATVMAETRSLLDQSTGLPDELRNVMDELEEAARSLRALADLIERDPQAFLRGKGS
jgi:paraquat-inducible protein B